MVFSNSLLHSVSEKWEIYGAYIFVCTCVCAYLNRIFSSQAPWALLTVYLMALVLHIVYYTLCHPGKPEVTKRGLLCCSGNRRDPLDSDDEKAWIHLFYTVVCWLLQDGSQGLFMMYTYISNLLSLLTLDPHKFGTIQFTIHVKWQLYQLPKISR